MTGSLRYIDLTFASSLTGAVEVRDYVVVGLITPASLGVAALTFKAAPSLSGTYIDVKDYQNNTITVTVDASTAYHYDISDIIPTGIQFIKLAGAATDAKVVTLIVRDL